MREIYPLKDKIMLRAMLGALSQNGCDKIAVASHTSESCMHSPAFFLSEGVTIHIMTHAEGAQQFPTSDPNRPYLTLSPAAAAEAGINGVIVIDKEQEGFFALMRSLEPLLSRGAVVLPLDPETLILSNGILNMQEQDAAQASPHAEYLAASNLRGNLLEFGTFWGRMFFHNYFSFREILRGRFWSFDSFAGLSKPYQEEIDFTGGDFDEGHYCCNRKTFEMYLDFLDIEKERIQVIEGFYEQTLPGKTGRDYGIEENSVAYCVLDCDLKIPSRHVLDFIKPLLEEGALIYFDDWRLTRGSLESGQRSATLEWLADNPDIELQEFARTSWGNQTFIFHRRKPGQKAIKQGISI